MPLGGAEGLRPMIRALIVCLLLTGCHPMCFQFDTNRNCPVIDFEVASD